jgi:type VI secretion system secreted protein Hcp
MAAVDFFLKIEGIEGESTEKGHEKWIDVQSFSWGETQAGGHGAGGGAGAGKVSMQDFHFTMQTNKASPTLLMACAQGKHFKDAQLTARKAGRDQIEYLKIKLTDVLVSSYQTGGSAGSEAGPTDQLSLNFVKIEFAYSPQKADGSLEPPISAWFDRKQLKG